MPASTQHPDYISNLQRWELVRDCVEGEDAIKLRRDRSGSQALGVGLLTADGTRYLPAPNARDSSQENLERYLAYRLRASFVNFTGFTKEGLLGMVFRKPAVIELPTGLEFLNDNADGGGTGIVQLLKDGIADTMETGRYGLLTDYPEAPAGLTQAQVEARGLRATISTYPAESIVNWRFETVGTITQLTLVVLKELVDKVEDDFEVEQVTHHRALVLIDGVYAQQLYDEDDKPIGPMIVPTKADGSTWSIIPFQFVGSQNNDPTPDKSVLLDLANVNVSHYRNSADYEESSFMVGQPTPVISGLSQSWVDDILKGGVMLGSRTAILLPDGGSGSLLQADPNSMPAVGMERKEQQMIMIGARIIQDSSGVETAEAAKIRFGGQNSKLAMLAGNWDEALTTAIKWAGEFQGTSDGKVKVEMNKQYFDATLTPQEAIAGTQLLDRRVIAPSDLRGKLRKTGWIEMDRTDEAIDDENGAVVPV
jgi:hypothetical protein